MALTLAEGGKLSNDALVEGVIESVINDSPILQRLPFVEIVGNGLTYNREKVAPTAAFYGVGEVWAENTPMFTQVTTTLSIFGGDARYPNVRSVYCDGGVPRRRGDGRARRPPDADPDR